MKKHNFLGIGLSLSSLLIFIFSELLPQDNFGGFGMASLLNFVIAVAYFFIAVIFNKKVKFSNFIRKPEYAYALVLFSLSAFTLNKVLPVFDKFVPWFLVTIILMHLAIITETYFKGKSKFLSALIYIVYGFSAFISLYASIYVAPLYYTIIGFWLLGLSLHVFVPILLTIFFFSRLIPNDAKKFSINQLFFLFGLLVAFAGSTVTSLKWKKLKSNVHEIKYNYLENNNAGLPQWVIYAREIPKNKFSRRAIETGINFSGAANFLEGFDNSLTGSRQHDPFLVIAEFFVGDLDLSRTDRINILKTQYGMRHGTLRRLWDDSDLIIADNFTSIQVYPEYRFAYYEDIFYIKNTIKDRWPQQQEARFTLNLPDGAVATSMSLWVNGKEEKSIITTREKADRAYREIVGVERRDPALMHWQEGNRVTVTVFPCTPDEQRKLKVGFTIPLSDSGESLVYNHPNIEGPSMIKTESSVLVEIVSDHSNISASLPKHFNKVANNKYEYHGNFKMDLTILTEPIASSKKAFFFNGNSYQIDNARLQEHYMPINSIYLDINKNWDLKTIEEILSAASENGIPVFTYFNHFEKIDRNNLQDEFNKLSKHSYSLFPFHLLPNPGSSMVVSYSSSQTPNLLDLFESKMYDDLGQFVANNELTIPVIDLAENSSSYLKSLRDFKSINLVNADLNTLKQQINSKVFSYPRPDSNQVYIASAKLALAKNKSTILPQGAPDHLMRLFVYNYLMKENARLYLTDPDFIDESEIKDVIEAHILTPASSFIVLETQADYERFDIEESKEGLKNASKNSDGAIPEPHEWALLILFVSALAFMRIRKIL